MPQNSVFAITQTTDGYLWAGTREGLARFDGLRFTVVDDKAAPHLRHGWITALCAARDGSLWIACDGVGVTRLKEGVWLPHMMRINAADYPKLFDGITTDSTSTYTNYIRFSPEIRDVQVNPPDNYY